MRIVSAKSTKKQPRNTRLRGVTRAGAVPSRPRKFCPRNRFHCRQTRLFLPRIHVNRNYVRLCAHNLWGQSLFRILFASRQEWPWNLLYPLFITAYTAYSIAIKGIESQGKPCPRFELTLLVQTRGKTAGPFYSKKSAAYATLETPLRMIYVRIEGRLFPPRFSVVVGTHYIYGLEGK